MKNFLIICMLFCSHSISSQSSDDEFSEGRNKKFFSFEIGFSAGVLPLRAFDENKDQPIQLFGLNMGFGSGIRYNVVELGDNVSIGIDLNPSFNLGAYGVYAYTHDPDLTSLFNLPDEPEVGFLSINVPLAISLNFGAGSTFDCISDRGFALKGGLDYSFSPLIIQHYGSTTKTLASPFAQFSYRTYNNRIEKVGQWFFRFNFLKNDETIIIPENREDDFHSPFFVTLGFSSFLNL